MTGNWRETKLSDMAISDADLDETGKFSRWWRIATFGLGAFCFILLLFLVVALVVASEQRAIVGDNASAVQARLEQEKEALNADLRDRGREIDTLHEENQQLRNILDTKNTIILRLESKIKELTPAESGEN